MTAMTGTRAAASKPEPELVRAQGGVRAVRALARVEARRLLLHPLVLVALVAYLTLLLWPSSESEDAYPVLQDIDRETQFGQLMLGLAVMVAVNLAVLRSHRRGTDGSFGVLVLPPWRRTVAHVLSVLPTVLVGALIVAGQFTAAALKPGAVGHGSVSELATGPLLVLLPAVLGVLLARVARSAWHLWPWSPSWRPWSSSPTRVARPGCADWPPSCSTRVHGRCRPTCWGGPRPGTRCTCWRSRSSSRPARCCGAAAGRGPYEPPPWGHSARS